MSLEKALVFQLKSQNKEKEYILDVVEGMREQGVRMNSKIVEVALSQYEARKELEKRGEYKRTFKDDLKDLIEKKKREIEDNYPNLLSIKLDKIGGYRCSNCDTYDSLRKIYADIEYLNGKGKIPVPQIESKFLLKYCKRCGSIDCKESI